VGTTAPKGILQLNNSYVVAPAPTGTAATDTQNINNAITAVSSGGFAGTVCLQAGTYVINNTITLPSSLKLIGAGINMTIIKLDKSDTGVPVLDTTNTGGVIIKDLQVTAVQTTMHIGLNISQSHFNSVENVHINNMDVGIFVSWDFNQFRNFFIHNCNTGILMGKTSDVTNGWCSASVFIGGQISLCNNYCIRCAYGHNNWFYSVTCELNWGPYFIAALALEYFAGHDTGGANLVQGCYFEDNDGDQIRIDSKGNKLIGNWICFQHNMIGPYIPFDGTGQYPNDLALSGTYTGTYTRTYKVKITTTGGTDKFEYSENGGVDWSSEFNITGAAQSLGNGVSITFAHVKGHTLNDCWSFNAYKAQNGINWVSGSGTADGNSLQANAVYSYNDGPHYNDVLLRNLGIGTASPAATFEVVGRSLFNGGNAANLDPAAFSLSILQNSGKMLLGWNRTAGEGEADFINNRGGGSNGGFAFYDYDNSGTLKQLMRLQSGGNAGIGTPSPSEKLTVATDNGGDGISLRKGDGSLRGFLARAGGGYGFLELYDDSTICQIKLYSVGNSYINGGSVGIGLTNPSSKLDVAGDVEIGNTNYFYLGDPSTDGSWRFHVTSNNLRFERRISGSWVDKGGFNG